MTKEDVSRTLFNFRILALVAAALEDDPATIERNWFRIARECGRPLREFLLEVDPHQDPELFFQAVQALEALREDQLWIKKVLAGEAIPFVGSWQ